MPEWVPINWGVIKNPLNWIIVTLMVLIAAMAWDILTRNKGTEN